MNILKSDKKNKRFVAVFKDGTKTHFGLKDGKTYIDHHDKIKKNNYILRHKVNENWKNYKSAGALSRYILWDDVDINKNIKTYKQKFL